MANLDTRDKRASAIGVGLPVPHLWPLADGTIVDRDQRQVALVYRSADIVDATSAVAPAGTAIPSTRPPAGTALRAVVPPAGGA